MGLHGMNGEYAYFTETIQSLCSPGHHYDSTGHTCQKCAKGYYSSNYGLDACQKCDSKKTTLNEGMESSLDCYGKLSYVWSVLIWVKRLTGCSVGQTIDGV